MIITVKLFLLFVYRRTSYSAVIEVSREEWKRERD